MQFNFAHIRVQRLVEQHDAVCLRHDSRDRAAWGRSADSLGCRSFAIFDRDDFDVIVLRRRIIKVQAIPIIDGRKTGMRSEAKAKVLDLLDLCRLSPC